MEIIFSIPGSIRSKKNSKRIFSMGRFKKVLPSKAYCVWEKQARNQLGMMCNIDPDLPLTCPISIEAHFYVKGPLPDLSGACESIGDCLEGMFYANDKQIFSWDGSRVHHDPKRPRTEIIIRYEVAA